MSAGVEGKPQSTVRSEQEGRSLSALQSMFSILNGTWFHCFALPSFSINELWVSGGALIKAIVVVKHPIYRIY